MSHMSINGFAWVLDDSGLSIKTPVAESGNLERMQRTIAWYAANSIRCEFAIIITD